MAFPFALAFTPAFPLFVSTTGVTLLEVVAFPTFEVTLTSKVMLADFDLI